MILFTEAHHVISPCPEKDQYAGFGSTTRGVIEYIGLPWDVVGVVSDALPVDPRLDAAMIEAAMSATLRTVMPFSSLGWMPIARGECVFSFNTQNEVLPLLFTEVKSHFVLSACQCASRRKFSTKQKNYITKTNKNQRSLVLC